VVENLVRSRSLDTLIVVKLCHAVFAPLNTCRMQGSRCSSGGEAVPSTVRFVNGARAKRN
jgi:hypothetical protein